MAGISIHYGGSGYGIDDSVDMYCTSFTINTDALASFAGCMIELIDRGDDWATIDWETEEIVYDESGDRKPIETSDLKFTRGKYEGYLLSEITDSWYLKFIRDKNEDDGLMKLFFNKRLGELK